MKRVIFYFVFAIGFVLSGWTQPPLRSSAALEVKTGQVGDRQPSASNLQNVGLKTAGINSSRSIAQDAHGNLYVVDSSSNRILEYDAPLKNNQIANRVFGQPDLSSSLPNTRGVSANSLFDPSYALIDAHGNLYVADSLNNRVLEYDAPLTGDTTADRVIGQPDFTSNLPNNGGVSANSLNGPGGLALDAQGNLYVADTNNNRVLEYRTPLKNHQRADRVLGEPDFISSAGGLSASMLYDPTSVTLTAQGTLFIVDNVESRVLEFDHPLTGRVSANRVFE